MAAFLEQNPGVQIQYTPTYSVGGKTGETCRRHGISVQTFYRWKAKYGGMVAGDAIRLKQLEEENRRLKKLVADQALDVQILKELLGKDF